MNSENGGWSVRIPKVGRIIFPGVGHMTLGKPGQAYAGDVLSSEIEYVDVLVDVFPKFYEKTNSLTMNFGFWANSTDPVRERRRRVEGDSRWSTYFESIIASPGSIWFSTNPTNRDTVPKGAILGEVHASMCTWLIAQCIAGENSLVQMTVVVHKDGVKGSIEIRGLPKIPVRGNWLSI